MNSLGQRLRLVFLAVIVIAILLVAGYALSRQGGAGWFPAVVFLALALLTVTYFAIAMTPGRRRLVGMSAQGGIGLSNSPVLAVVLLGFVGAFFLLPVSLALAWLRSGDRPTSAAGPLVLLAVTLLAAVPLLVGLLRGRYRLGGLLLTPDGVSYQSFLRTHSLSWDEISAITRHPTQPRLELRTEGAAVVTGPRPSVAERPVGTRRSQQLDIPAGLLRTDTTELQRLLEVYRGSPRRRQDLGDGSALAPSADQPS